MKPHISDEYENVPYYLSFVKKRIKSEMIYPFELKDGKVAILVLPSAKHGYFTEKHVKEIENAATELSSVMEMIEKLTSKKAVVLYEIGDFKKAFEDIVGKEFPVVYFTKIKDIEEFSRSHSVEFIFSVCSFKCSTECREISGF